MALDIILVMKSRGRVVGWGQRFNKHQKTSNNKTQHKEKKKEKKEEK